MNRAELQELAGERAREAETLLKEGHWSGAYYLIGYAAECALKACIAKLTKEHDFPDKDRTLKSYTHDIATLVRVADLTALSVANTTANPIRKDNWRIVNDWDEQARYQRWTEAEARELFTAVMDPTNGVLPWIMGHW